MNAVTFDTLKFARALEEDGAFTPDQSSRLADVLGRALGADLATKADVRESELSLKADLRQSELSLRADLRETELRLEAKIEATKADLLKWLFGLVGFQTLVIVGSLVAIARPIH